LLAYFGGKMTKKLLSLLSVLLVAAFVLSACAPAATPAPTTAPVTAPTEAPKEQPTVAQPTAAQPESTQAPAESTAKKHLTIWHAYAGQDDKVEFINYAMNSFKEKYPEIEIEEVPMEHSSYKVKLNTAMASGNPPDVFYTLPGGYLGAFVKGGQIYALDEELKKDGWGDSFIPSAMKSVSFDGKTYAVPIDIDATAVWYNKKLFETNGWQTPKTWDEFTKLCDQIKAKGIVPVALGNKDRWPATFWFQFPELRLAGTGIVDKFNAGDTSASFDPEGVKPLQLMADIAKAGYFPEGFNGMTDSEANILFLNGQAAMVLNGTWQIGMSADASPDTFDLGFFPFPTFSDGKGDQTDVVAGVAASFAISEKAQDKESAVLFLKHLTSMEVMKKYVEIRKTMVTVKGATTEENAGPVLYGITSGLIEKAASLDAFYDTAMPPAAMEAYYTVLQGVLDGTIKPADGAATLNKAMKEGK
jgi:raffinose/stachyose/melibiose transport system substrate-binding protein